MKKIIPTIFFFFVFYLCNCQAPQGGNSGGVEFEGSSAPINEKEKLAYKRALLNCYKSGGTRIVKIKSQLRCF